jgi:hypothetical protein
VQGKHIGAPVLRRAMDAGRRAGATTFFVWASIDLPAISAYMKSGMLPGGPILVFEGAAKPAAVDASYVRTSLDRQFANALDRDVLEMPREIDHDMMLHLGWQPRQVLCLERAVGYYYVHEGVVGPVAWTEPGHARSVLALGCAEAATSGLPVRLMAHGLNHDALRFAFDAGLRLTSTAHLLFSRPFGHLERYLPSGPALF